MENSKYYVPEISEFHVGFEYESFEIPLNPSFAFESKPAEWVKRKVLDINNSEYKDKALYHVSINNRYEENVEWNKNIRVKYLDSQDILDLGFEQLETNPYLKKEFINNKEFGRDEKIYFGEFFDNRRYIAIENNCGQFYFMGWLKNKKELEKILNQIGV